MGFDDIDYDEENRPRKPKELHPAREWHGVCVDVIDIGMVLNRYKKNDDGSPIMDHKIRIVWETDALRSDGTRFTISKSYKLSLYDGTNGGKPSTLYTDLKDWLGATWDGRFKSDMLQDRPAVLYIRHDTMNNPEKTVYPKVVSVNTEDGDPVTASGHYKRFVKKDKDDDSVPF